jgi:hypothetical protein
MAFKQSGNFPAGILDHHFGFSAMCMRTAGISELLTHGSNHGFYHHLIQWAGCGVIEIDSVHLLGV